MDNTTNTKQLPKLPFKAILCFARRDTRWDVYPQREPRELIAFNYQGFHGIGQRADGSWYWFKSPTSYVLEEKDVDPARAFETWTCDKCGAQWTDRPVGCCYQCKERSAPKPMECSRPGCTSPKFLYGVKQAGRHFCSLVCADEVAASATEAA